MKSNITDEEIYQKAKKRHRSKNDYNLVIKLEKEIDYYRSEVQRMEEAYLDNDPTWFKLKPNTNSEELYKFIFSYLPFGKVVKLHSLLSKDLRGNYIDEIYNHTDEKL